MRSPMKLLVGLAALAAIIGLPWVRPAEADSFHVGVYFSAPAQLPLVVAAPSPLVVVPPPAPIVVVPPPAVYYDPPVSYPYYVVYPAPRYHVVGPPPWTGHGHKKKWKHWKKWKEDDDD